MENDVHIDPVLPRNENKDDHAKPFIHAVIRYLAFYL